MHGTVDVDRVDTFCAFKTLLGNSSSSSSTRHAAC